MSNRGMSMMGIGMASGEDRAERAVEMALSSPLLDDIELHGAQGLLANVTCDESLSLEEYEYIRPRVSEHASEEADAKTGMLIHPILIAAFRSTLVSNRITGCGATAQRPTLSQPPTAGQP